MEWCDCSCRKCVHITCMHRVVEKVTKSHVSSVLA